MEFAFKFLMIFIEVTFKNRKIRIRITNNLGNIDLFLFEIYFSVLLLSLDILNELLFRKSNFIIIYFTLLN